MSKNKQYSKEIFKLFIQDKIKDAEALFWQQDINNRSVSYKKPLIKKTIQLVIGKEKRIEIFSLLIPLIRPLALSENKDKFIVEEDKIIIADEVISLYKQKKLEKSEIVKIFSEVAKKEYFKEDKKAVKYIGSLLLKEFGNKDIGDNANFKDCYKEMIYSLLSQAIIKYNDLSYFDLEEPKFEAKAEIYIKEHNELAKDLIKDEIAKKFVNDDVKEESDKWKEGDESPALPKDIISSQLLQCLPKKPNAKPLQQDKSNVTDQSK